MDGIYNSLISRKALSSFLSQISEDEKFYQKQLAVFLNSLYERAIRDRNKKFFLDKTPRYYLILEELAQMFPAARFILLFRNPIAVFNSIMETWVKDDISMLGNYIQDLLWAPEALIRFSEKYSESESINSRLLL